MTIEKLKSKLQENRIREFFEDIQKIKSTSINSYQFEIDTLKLEYEELERNIKIGVIPHEDSRIKKNKLTRDLIVLLRKIDKSIKAVDSIFNNADSKIALYREKMEIQFNQIDSLLYIDRKVNLDEIFYPIKLVNNGKLFTPATFLELSETASQFLILGDAGSGKTTLLRHIFLKLSGRDKNLPFFIEFKKILLEVNDFESFVISYISDILVINKPDIKTLLEEGYIYILMDGLDEYRHLSEPMLYSIEKFTIKYPKTRLVLSSRPGIIALNNTSFGRYNVKPFDIIDAISFVKRQKLSKDVKKEALKLLSKQSREFASFFEDDLRVYALKSPLLLTMFLLTLKEDRGILLGNSNADFFKLTTEKLIKVTKNRDKNSSDLRLSANRISKIIEIIAWETFIKNKVVFTEIEVQDIIDSKIIIDEDKSIDPEKITDYLILSSILIQEGMHIKFFHKSIQDYLAIKSLERQNFEEKQKSYQRIFQLISERPHANYEVLLFLREIAYPDFKKFILLPTLKEFCLNPAEVNDEVMLEKFFAKYEYLFGYHFIEELMRVEYNESLMRAVDVTEVVLQAANLEPNIYSNKVKEFYYQLEEANGEKFNSELSIYPLVKRLGKENYLEIFDELEITKHIREYYQKIFDCIKAIEIE